MNEILSGILKGLGIYANGNVAQKKLDEKNNQIESKSSAASSSTTTKDPIQNYLDAVKNWESPNPGYITVKKDTQENVDISDNDVPTTGGGGGGGGYYGTYTPSSFKPSDTYNQAMAYTQSLLDQLNSGRTSYTDQINALMNQINNREKFNYDFNTDPLFQSQLQSNTEAGRMAMQDTMGQAAALTGGYGSTYAQAVGNQAYNQYIQDAYSNLGDYYGMALDKYNSEGQDLYNQLGMYSQADQLEYDRLANAYQLNAANAANLYDQEYNNYWQTQQMAQDASQFNANMRYKQDQANAESVNSLYESYQKQLDDDYNTRKQSLPSDTTIKQTALGLMTNQGIQSARDYLLELQTSYGDDVFTDAMADAIESYVVSQTQNKVVERNKNDTIKKKDDTYVDAYGNTLTYEEALKLKLIDKNGKPIEVK